MSVYPPREDTYFLKNYLESLELEGMEVLEVGCGSGILSVAMAGKGAEVTAVDINPEAVEATREAAEEAGVEVDVFRSDLFREVEDKFDLIVFNPPYLPGRELEGDEKWRGGDRGVEVTERFLQDYGKHLKEGGKALFLLSSLSDHRELLRKHEVVESENLWFETLYLVRGE
ncbi:MAG: HemK2/MTQ2 family protein methyltransferase [Candidatus Nanohaloarchaea archaeon]